MDRIKRWDRINPEMVLYRIVPDRSVTNNQNRRFWRLVHDLMALDHTLRARIKRDGMNFTYTARDTVWMDIVMRAITTQEMVDGELEEVTRREVNFYLCFPAKYARTFVQKVHDRFPQVTMEEQPLDAIVIPASAQLSEFRLQRHDVFSLKCNDAEQNSPISSFLNVAYDLHGDDFARLSFCMERMDRRSWQRAANHAWKQLEQKRVPNRARIDVGLLARQFGDIFRHIGYEAKSVVDDLLQAVQNVMKSGDKMTPTAAPNFANAEYTRVMVNGELSPVSKKKRFDASFKTRIRLAVASKDRSRSHLIQYGMANAFADMAEDNSLLPAPVRINLRAKVLDELNTFTYRTRDKDPNILSCKEVGKLHQYPTADMQVRYGELLQSKARIEVEVPRIFRDEKGILMGHSEYRGESVPVYLPFPTTDRGRDEFMMSRVFIGSPRMGKDTAICNFVVEAALKGCGAVVLDVIDERGNDRGMADSIRDALPPDKVIDLDMANLNHPFYLGLSEVVSRSENAGNRLANDFATIFEVEDNGRTRTYLREAIKACSGDLLEVRLLLLCDGRDGDVLDMTIRRLRMEEKHYAAEFWEAYKAESKGQKSEIRKPIINRLEEIFGDDHLKNMFGQEPNPDIDFSKWLKEGKVILVRVPNSHPDLSELSVKTICQWIVLKTFLTKLVMADKDCCSFLVLNEPHQFMSPGLEKVLNRMLRECPKWRLSLLFAIHDFSRRTIPKDLLDALLSASLNWHVFKNTNLEVYEKIKHLLQPTYDAESAMQQTPAHYAINLFLQKGEYATPFLLHALPPVNSRREPHDNIKLTLEHAKRYGRPRKVVEADIFEKEKVLFRKKAPAEK